MQRTSARASRAHKVAIQAFVSAVFAAPLIVLFDVTEHAGIGEKIGVSVTVYVFMCGACWFSTYRKQQRDAGVEWPRAR